MKLLVVTADDFGLSPGVNQGILEAHTRGIVTATSLMVNLPYSERAARLVRAFPSLDVGVHLNLTTGPPLTDCQLLVRADGKFRRPHELALRTALSARARREAHAELRAQIEQAISWGIQPSHVDGHHHIHVLPQLVRTVLGMARQLGAAVRRPHESLGLPRSGAPVRELTIGLSAGFLDGYFRRHAIRSSDHFVGYRLRGATFTTEAVLRVLSPLGHGVTELMAHPAHPDDELARWTSYAAGREIELATICDPGLQRELERRDWRIVGWRVAGAIAGQW